MTKHKIDVYTLIKSEIHELKKAGIENCKIEGKESNDWKLVDTIDVIVHIFHPEKRKFYDLEKMWCDPSEISGFVI